MDDSFKINKDSLNKNSILGKKRDIEKGYKNYYPQLFKKKK